jgi:hypothetical protein
MLVSEQAGGEATKCTVLGSFKPRVPSPVDGKGGTSIAALHDTP